LGDLAVRRTERSRLDDQLDDGEVGRQRLALLGDPDVVLVAVVVRALVDVVREAHADQARHESDQE
jgi:hypothetical protein